MIGDWESGCVTDDFVRRVDYSFTANYMEFYQINYDETDLTCSSPTFSERYRFNYAASNGLLEVKEIIRIFLTSYTQSEVEWYNNSYHCGFDDWEIGEEKEVELSLCPPYYEFDFGNGEYEVTTSTLTLREYGTAPSVNDPVFNKK